MSHPTITPGPTYNPDNVIVDVTNLLAAEEIKSRFSGLEIHNARPHATALLVALGVVPVVPTDDVPAEYTGRDEPTGGPLPGHVEGYALSGRADPCGCACDRDGSSGDCGHSGGGARQ